MIYPELLVSRLVAEELDDNECVVVSGCERFNNYTGYGDSFRWTGDVVDRTSRDNSGRITRQVSCQQCLYASSRSTADIQRHHSSISVLH